MKTSSVLKLFVNILFASLFASCSKDIQRDSPELNSIPAFVGTEVKNKAINRNPVEYGAVSGFVLPVEAKVSVTLVGNSTIALYLNENGAIIKNFVPEGFYTAIIHPLNPLYIDYVINDVQIIGGTITDIGTIFLNEQGDTDVFITK